MQRNESTTETSGTLLLRQERDLKGTSTLHSLPQRVIFPATVAQRSPAAFLPGPEVLLNVWSEAAPEAPFRGLSCTIPLPHPKPGPES